MTTSSQVTTRENATRQTAGDRRPFDCYPVVTVLGRIAVGLTNALGATLAAMDTLTHRGTVPPGLRWLILDGIHDATLAADALTDPHRVTWPHTHALPWPAWDPSHGLPAAAHALDLADEITRTRTRTDVLDCPDLERIVDLLLDDPAGRHADLDCDHWHAWTWDPEATYAALACTLDLTYQLTWKLLP